MTLLDAVHQHRLENGWNFKAVFAKCTEVFNRSLLENSPDFCIELLPCLRTNLLGLEVELGHFLLFLSVHCLAFRAAHRLWSLIYRLLKFLQLGKLVLMPVTWLLLRLFECLCQKRAISFGPSLIIDTLLFSSGCLTLREIAN